MKQQILYYINDTEYLYFKRKVYKIDDKLYIKINGIYHQVFKRESKIGNVVNINYSNKER